MKPVVGLIPLFDNDKDSYWMLPGYMLSLEACGALPIMLPLSTDTDELKQLADMCDGLLMTGGHDVSPDMYGADASEKCGETCELRDKMEKLLFTEFYELDKPVLGICRGIQLMNVLMGGSLYQDLETEYESDIEHHMSKPYDRVAHKVNVMDNTPLADIIGAGTHGVNSYHHQAVRDVADSVKVMATAEDNLVEAIYVPDKSFIMAIQWHPEFSYKTDGDALKIMQAFADACRKN